MSAIPVNPSNMATDEEKSRVLTTAFIRTSDHLGLTRQELSLIIGRSEASLSRLFTQSGVTLMPSSKEGQLAILLIRLYRSLDVLFGGNQQQCRTWLRSKNQHLESTPIELIKTIEGFVFTIQYLDAIRGKN